MIPKIDLLLQLQELDLKIKTINKEKDSIPVLLTENVAVLDNQKSKIEVLKTDLSAKQMEKKNLELDLAKTEESINKHNFELNSVKSNDLYKNILEVIKNEKERKEELEDKILQILDQIDVFDKSMNQEKEELKKVEVAVNQKKQEFDEKLKTLNSEIEQLHKQRSQIILEIADTKLVALYEKILANKKGHALAYVQRETSSCSGCNLHVPPQVLTIIESSTAPVLCEHCNRILYIKKD